ncbi:unnamed protein product [Rotaria sordida]|uniref:S-adenosyl-L-methionine-dependent methyltransferase n=1 Tax=Rotaria sordida TaxID=392033 RepID=A0A814FV57_9BILA|nr:unnamed protein product [Rotaria sordida]CAF0990508.1 unnamed protein product [Rotaria sordida]
MSSFYEKIENDPVGRTSMGSATGRAVESKRCDALFQDPFADIYAGQFGPQGIEILARMKNTTIESITNDTAVRTRYIDDLLEQASSTNRQCVILACGGDFRPFRLSLINSSQTFEFYLLDVSGVLIYRQKCFEQLDPRSFATNHKVTEIACNLADEEWSSKLVEHGFNTDQPTIWLAEGFFHYLTEEDIRKLFERIRQLSASDSCIVFDVASTQLRNFVPMIHFALDDEQEIHRIFNGFGCESVECTPFQKIGAMYGRTVSRDRSFIVKAKLSRH